MTIDFLLLNRNGKLSSIRWIHARTNPRFKMTYFCVDLNSKGYLSSGTSIAIYSWRGQLIFTSNWLKIMSLSYSCRNDLGQIKLSLKIVGYKDWGQISTTIFDSRDWGFQKQSLSKVSSKLFVKIVTTQSKRIGLNYYFPLIAGPSLVQWWRPELVRKGYCLQWHLFRVPGFR